MVRRWNVVQDDRQRGRDRDRPEMRLDAGLHRLVVVRHHRKHRIGAGRFGALRQLDRLAGRIGSGAGMTRTRPRAISTAVRMMPSCSAGVSVEASPVVSLTRMARDAGLNLALAKHSQGLPDPPRRVHRTGWECRVCSPPARWRELKWTSWGYHAAFSIWPKPCRIGRQHEPLLAPDTGFDPKAHLLQPFPDAQAGAAFPAVDQDRDGGAGAKEWR